MAASVLLAPGVAVADPPLTNDPSCAPNPLLHGHDVHPAIQGPPPGHGHPPVILVHGTAVVANQEQWMADWWTPLAGMLIASGYCPWVLTYPTNMQSDSAAPDALRSFVNTVLANTNNGDGTGQVSMVGHSQGGMQIRHMLLHYSTAPVRDAISLAGSQKGSAHPGGPACPTACPPGFAEQLSTSPFYDHLNPGCAAGGVLNDMNCWAPAYGGADYTNVTTVEDELIVPYWRALMGPYPHVDASSIPPRLHNSSAEVSDIVLQAWCPAAHAEHAGIVDDPHVFRIVLDALGRSGPADATLPCAFPPQQ